MMAPSSNRPLSAALVALALAACGSPPASDTAAIGKLNLGDQLVQSNHRGPAVVAGAGGTARFAGVLYEDFDTAYALGLLEFVDGFYRAPANAGYEAVIDRIAADLRSAGFGTRQGLELFEIETPLTGKLWSEGGARGPVPAWTPVSASLSLIHGGRESVELLSFAAPGDSARTMLPIHAPSSRAQGEAVFDLDEVRPGTILVTQVSPRHSILQRAAASGAVAVLSSYLDSYNIDPSGAGRERDAIQFRSLDYGGPLPVLMISPAVHESIESACLADPTVRLSLSSEVLYEERPLRTLVAVVRGQDRPEEAFVVASHVQEPGANDNATGVVGLAESARSLARLLAEGRIKRPSRSLVFLWGDEFRQTSAFLEVTDMRVVGGLSSDMTGASREQTGAICLLERMPDPAAIEPLLPDEHTPWGMREVDPESLKPNGLAVIARCALADVGALQPDWQTSEHPYEGGSDHDIFIARGLPTALFWHFTDFTYHTSLDRMSMVDVGEVRRTAAVILATSLALADPQPGDLDRYLRTLNQEQNVRVDAAMQAEQPELAESWRQWCEGARHWLRVECLRIPPSEQ